MPIQSTLLPQTVDEPEENDQAFPDDEAKEPARARASKQDVLDAIDDHNLARHADQQTLDSLGQIVLREFQIDVDSRSEWKDEAEKALKFATQEAETKQYPWPKASNIVFPLITTAALQFWAKAYPAVVPGRNVVKGVVWGTDDGTPATQDGSRGSPPQIGPDGSPVWLEKPGAKRKRADKIGEHMSFQLLEQMPEWDAQTSAALMQLPIVGGAVRKTYRDTVEDCSRSVLVPLMNFVWNFHAQSFEKAPRHTEILTLYPHQIKENERDDDTFLPIIYGAETGDEDNPSDQNDADAPVVFLEQHRRYDLDGDGYPEPLVVTVHKTSGKVVRIVARYDEDGIETSKDGSIFRIKPCDYYTLYPFLPNPKGGSHPVGFGHLLKPLNEAINTSINQMFDAGHLQIAGGGFIGSGMSIHAGPVNFQLGQYKPVNNKGQSIRDNVFPIPFPGPNAVLFQLLGFLTQAAKETASIQDILSGAPELATAQPTTMLALIETGMRVYTAIYKGVFGALKSEFSKLYRLNRLYLKEKAQYRVGDAWCEITPEDYRLGGGVEPVADPTMVTDMQKLGRAAVLLQFKDDPLFNPIEVRRRYLDAANIANQDQVLLQKMPPPPPALQMEMAMKQAELGRSRAAELKDQSQAFLNMASARAKAGDQQMVWIDKQLEFMRMHIEALNTTVKAADVDSKFHGHRLTERGQDLDHKARMAEVARRAREVADEGPTGGNASFPEPPGAAAGPTGGTVGPGVSGMAPASGNGSAPALPQGPGPGL